MQTELEKLLSEFKPEFGNTEHIRILEQVGRYRALRKRVTDHQKTVDRLTRQVNKKSAVERDLEKVSNQLVFALMEQKKTA